MTDLAALERAVLTAAPDDAPPVHDMLANAPAPVDADCSTDLHGDDLIGPDVFADQWAHVHDLLGGMVAMRSGNPCPLGDQARGPGGQVAAQAAYNLLSSTPILARMFLGTQSGFIGQIMVLSLHGYACVQIVKAANSNAAPEIAA